MKDLKVYDGAGWQSLKGPPGPSTPSTDAGNLLTTGSDGLLYAPTPERGLVYSYIELYSDADGPQPTNLAAEGPWAMLSPAVFDEFGSPIDGMIQWSVFTLNIQTEGIIQTGSWRVRLCGIPFPLNYAPDISVQIHFPAYPDINPPCLMGKALDANTIEFLIVGEDGKTRPFIPSTDIPPAVDAYFRVTVVQQITQL